MENIGQVAESLSNFGITEAVIIASLAALPNILKYLNDRRLAAQTGNVSSALAGKERAEADKTIADAVDVITDTSMQWIELLKKDVAELSARADSSDAANKILLEAKATERIRRKELEASIRIMAEQQEADRAESRKKELRYQAERDAWTLEKESLKNFWETDRILLMSEVERCYSELKQLIESVDSIEDTEFHDGIS